MNETPDKDNRSLQLETCKEIVDAMVDGFVCGHNNAIKQKDERIKQLEEAGNRLAFLMLNGSTSEIRSALWSWRELVPVKKDDSNG
jgi:hypothetical protein